MKLTRFGTAIVFSVAAIVTVAAGGCEAIVSNDVPAFTCSMTPYVDAGTGSCPAGSYCEGAGCVTCNPKGDDPCDGYDNDCDGVIDDGPKSDHDGDGYTYCGKIDPTSGKQYDVDCNDDDKTISPAGHEVCNGKDDNCDGIIDNPTGQYAVCPANYTCVPAKLECIPNQSVCVSCEESDAGGCCALPNVCDPNTQECVAPASQDAGTTGCTSNVQCTTGICATSTELGAGQPSVCTLPCCTSADCSSLGSGYVCYGAGTGGNYCVSSASLGRSVPATCCSNSDCTGGKTCTATAGSASGTASFTCETPPGNGGANATCKANSDCQSGYCAGYVATDGFGDTENVYACAPPCCGSKQCGQLEDNQLVCNDDYYPPPSPSGTAPTSGPVIGVCDLPQEGTGHEGTTPPTGQVGNTCTKTTDCYSNQCLIFSSGQFCSDVCCVDSDCATAGWVCRPFPVGAGTYLRCVPQTGSSE